MKIRLLQPMNIEGHNYQSGDEIQIAPRDGQALVRAGLAVAVIERAVERPQVEIRGE